MMTRKFRLKTHLKQLGASLVGCLLACGLHAQSTPQISNGDDLTAVIDTAGNLYTFGSGPLGIDGDASLSPDPVVVEPAFGWQAVAVSRGPEPHVLAIRNGTLWAWGSNDRGQLGDGTQDDSTVPVQISLATNWVEVAAGEDFSLGRTSSGEIYVWGDNTYGQLGYGPIFNDPALDIATTPKRVPPLMEVGGVSVPNPLFTDTFIAISAGNAHAHAIRADGTLWTWGIGGVPFGGNELGLLINGNFPLGAVLPTQVGTATGWTDLFGGYTTTYALRNTDTETGQLWCWGGGGLMGNGSSNELYSVPTRIGNDSAWSSVSRSANHTLALKSDGTAYGWGLNFTNGASSGELGLPIFDGGQIIFTNLQRLSPTRLESPTLFAAIGAGERFSVMLNTDGFLISAGMNDVGQLGNGSIDQSTSDGQDFFANSNLGTADLAISEVIVTTTEIDLADPLYATVTVRNGGSGIVEDDIELAAVLSPTSNFDDLTAIPLTILSGQPITTDLSPGGSLATNLEMELPAVINAGTYFLVVRVDPNNLIEETRVDNNDSADLRDGDDDDTDPDGLLFQADLQILSADIVVTPDGGSFPLETGEEINVQVTISNEDIGSIPEQVDGLGNFALRFVLSREADLTDVSVTNLSQDDPTTPDLDESLIRISDEVLAGGSIVLDYDFVLPDSMGVGEFYVGLVVDVLGEVEESEEDNNLAFTGSALVEVVGLDLGEALDNLDEDFITGGEGIWYGSDASDFGPGGEHEVDTGALNGYDAAVSPPIGEGQSAYISMTLDETSLISFRWKSNTSSPENRLTYRYLGAEVGLGDNEISGITDDWIEVQRVAPAGKQIIWQYTMGVDASGDQVYLDDIQILGAVTEPDFIIDDVELIADEEGNSGSYVLGRDRLDLALFVRNQGTDYSAIDDGVVDVRVYLSKDGNFNADNDPLIFSLTDDIETSIDEILQGNSSLIQPSIALATNLDPGNYRLVVIVDEDENVDEVLEDNNTYISPEPLVEIIALPDFTIEDMNPEAGFYLIGDNLDFSLTLKNNGLIEVFEPIGVRIVLSTDNIFDESDYVFGDFVYEGGLAAGGEDGDSNTFSPDIAQIREDIGPIADFLYFGVIIDPDDEHEELDENDNAVFYVDQDGTPLPDFIFAQVTLNAAMEFDEIGLGANNNELPSFFGIDNTQNKPFVGQTIESASGPGEDAAQSSDIANGEAATFSVNFTADADTIISFDWRTSSEYEVLENGGIKADWLIVYVDDVEVGRIGGDLEWSRFSQRVDEGTHTVRWEYVKDGSISAGQDTAWVDNFQYRLPDLEISNVSVAAQSVNTGDVVNVSFTVTNVGEDPVPATPSYSVDARLSPDNLWGGDGDVPLALTPEFTNSGELQPGGAINYTGSVVVPAGFAEVGSFFLGLRVDPDPDFADEPLNGTGLILETDEANNTIFTDTALIMVTPPVTLNEALDIDSSVVLVGGGQASWFGIDSVDQADLPPGTPVDPDLDDIARSGSVGLDEVTYFETQVTGPQVIKYRWKVDSPSSNTLDVRVNGLVEESISGRVDWDFGFGPFTITYDGETTLPLRSEATAAEVQDAMNALSTIVAAGEVTVSGPDLDVGLGQFTYTITFDEDGDQQGQMTFNALDINRVASSSLTTSGNGSSIVAEVRSLVIEPNVYFTLSYAGQTTDLIPYYASEDDVEVALNALSSITSDGGVTVDYHPDQESALDFLVRFNTLGERELITVNAAGLRQPVTIEAELNSDRFKLSGSQGVAGDVAIAQVQPLRIGPEITLFVPAGSGLQTIRWTFSSNSELDGFENAGWMDQLRIFDIDDLANPSSPDFNPDFENFAELVLTDLSYVAGTYVLDVGEIAGAPDQKLGTEVLDITIQAQNQGLDIDPAIGQFTAADLEVRLSTDRLYGNIDDIVLGSFSQVEGTLESGDLMIFLGGLPLGDHIPEGDYYLIAKIDANERVEEFSSENNIVITQDPDVRVERKPRLLIYDAFSDENLIGTGAAFYVDVVDYDESKLYYPEAPMRLQMEIQNVGLDDLFDENGQVLNWRVNYRLAFLGRDDLDSLLEDGFSTDDFDGAVAGYIDLGSTTIAEAMEGRRLSAPDGDRVGLDVEYTLPTSGRMLQVIEDGESITSYIYFIQITVDADDTVDESGIVNVWNNVDLLELQNTTIPTTDVEDGLFSIFTSAPTSAEQWGSVYGVVADAGSANPAEVDNFVAYAFNRNPASGDTAGSQFPGTYGVDTLDLEDYLTVTFDILTVSNDLAYIVEASNGVDFDPSNLISTLTIEPPFDSLVGIRSLTGEGGLIDQVGVAGGAQIDPEDLIEVISVVDEGYSARVTVRYPTTLADTLSGFMRIQLDSFTVVDLSSLETFVRDEMVALGITDSADYAPGVDFDMDGVSNLVELMYGTDPTLIGDVPTLSDPEDTYVAEVLATLGFYGVGLIDIAASDDLDGDSTSNIVEIVAGTDPNDNTDEPTAIQLFVAEALVVSGVLDTLNTGPSDDYDSDGVSSVVELLLGFDPNDNGSTPVVDDIASFVASELANLGVLSVGASDIGPEDDFDSDGVVNLLELISGSDPTDNGSSVALSGLEEFVIREMAEDGVLLVGATSIGPDDDFDLDGVSNLLELMFGTNTNDIGDAPVLSALEVSVAEYMAPFIEAEGSLAVGLSDLGPNDDFDADSSSNLAELYAGTDPAVAPALPQTVVDFVDAEMTALGATTGAIAPDEDFDLDGVNNLVELQYGTDPTDQNSTPAVDAVDVFVAENMGAASVLGEGAASVSPEGDYDADNVSNLVELLDGTNPNDSSDTPTLIDLEIQVAEAMAEAGALGVAIANIGPADDYDADSIDNLAEIYAGTDPADPSTVSGGLDTYVVGQMAILGATVGPIGALDDFDGDGVNNLTEIQYGTSPIDDGSTPNVDAVDVFVAEQMAENGELGSVTAVPTYTAAVDVGPTDDQDVDGVNNLVEILLGTDPTNGADTPSPTALEAAVAEDMAEFGALGAGIANIGPFDDYDLDGSDNVTEIFILDTDPTQP